MAKRDYYEVLGIKRDANEAQIRSAYRKLARKFHPDVNKAPGAADKFKEATEAYEVLSDAQKRGMYDQFGHAGPNNGPSPGGEATYNWHGRPGGGAAVGFEEILGGFGGGLSGLSLEEILQSLGGGRRGARAQARSMGADLESHLTLDFLDAVRGTTTSLRLQRPEASGGSESITVRIPPGVSEGGRVRIRGKGADGAAARGDLYIVLHIREHPYFRREGDDIYVDVPIGLAEAALGAKVDVPTVDGMTTVTIPPGSPSGRHLRLRGKGVASPDGSRRGDQYAVIRIVPPPKLSSRGAELLRDFNAAERFDPRANAPWK